MKTHFKHQLVLIAGVLLASSGWQVAHAQRDAISRDNRSNQRQTQMANMTPQQRLEYFNNRFDERLKAATPEQRQRMLEMRAQVEQKMKDAGISATDPDAWQKMQNAGVLNGIGGQNGPGNGQNGGRGNRAERAAADAMKQMMNAAGIADFDAQDAVIAYVADQNKARATLLQLAQTAATALQAPVVAPVNVADNGAVEAADSKVATTFKAYENAVQAENDRQTKALTDLDAKIHYSTTPRIKAFLTLVGILNNDVLAIGGPAAVFSPAQNGQGQGGWNGGNGRGNGG